MWACTLCNYSTSNIYNYNRHTTSNSHKIALKKSFLIKEKKIKAREIKQDALNKKLESIDNNLLAIKNKQEKIEKTQLEMKREQIETSKGVKKITDYIDFLNTYCTNVKPLTLLGEDEVDELLGCDEYDNFKFEEMILKYVKSNKLHIKLSDLVLKKYSQKSDLTKQRIWTSDISRLIYLIFRVIGKQRNWVRDKRGELFTELITTPIINRIEKMMRIYKKHMLSKFNSELLDDDRNATYLDNAQTAEQLMNPFYTNKLKHNMLKYMAGKFSITLKHKDMLDELC
jgi:hypothetical protein